jgi:hypothetical protein
MWPPAIPLLMKSSVTPSCRATIRISSVMVPDLALSMRLMDNSFSKDLIKALFNDYGLNFACLLNKSN